MTLLYPSVLWLLIPLVLLLWSPPRRLVITVHLIILMLLLLALSRPVAKEAAQTAEIEAKDIIIALDISYSMKATDITPTRYDFAKETIASLLDSHPADNIMLMAFTTNPLLLSPPTTDHTLIKTALKSLNPEFILTKGTSLENLFKKLVSMKLGHKQLILITDGGEEENLEALTKLLQDSDLSLTVLALGSRQGTTVRSREGKPLKDREGNLVISRINPLLKSLSASLSGTYLTASSTAKTSAQKLYSSLEEKKKWVQKMQYRYTEYYQIPLALALLLFLMLHTRAIKYLILLSALWGVQAEASLLDIYHLNRSYKHYKEGDYPTAQHHLKQIEKPSLQSQMALANAHYKEGAFKKAVEIYRAIRSTSPKVKQQLYYNIATAYAKMARYSKAKQYYAKTLQLGEDADAKHNLHLIALLADKKSAPLGIAHPKSQSTDSHKSEAAQEGREERRSEEQPGSGSGSGKESSSKEERERRKLLSSKKEEQQHPLSSKVYELINRGYIHEKQPW